MKPDLSDAQRAGLEHARAVLAASLIENQFQSRCSGAFGSDDGERHHAEEAKRDTAALAVLDELLGGGNG